MSLREEVLAVARLDWAEVLRSRWLVVCAGIYVLLGILFVLVGLRESAVLGFTGAGRVLLSLCHGLVLLLPLLALLVTGQVVNRARDDGGLELLMSQPIGRTAYLVAVTGVRYLALTLPLLLTLAAIGLFARMAYGQLVPWSFLLRSGAVSAALLWAFVGLGLATSVRVRSPARAVTWVLLFWAAGVALLDFALVGLMLQWRLDPHAVFLLAASNPVEAARLALLSAVDPELPTLGPVGFFLAHRLGSGALLALGIVWPLAFGSAAWLVALRSLRRGDLV